MKFFASFFCGNTEEAPREEVSAQKRLSLLQEDRAHLASWIAAGEGVLEDHLRMEQLDRAIAALEKAA